MNLDVKEVIRVFSPAIVIMFVIDFCLICYLVSCFKGNKNWSKLYKAEDILIALFVIIAIWLGYAYVNSSGGLFAGLGEFVLLLYSIVITANLVLVYIVSKFVHYLKRRKRRKRK